MTSPIRHRGPNDEGYVLFYEQSKSPVICGGEDSLESSARNPLAYLPTTHIHSTDLAPVSLSLGHRRLSILDLSLAGHQPMCDRNQRYWVVYNGEIYNHLALRKELEGLGHQFISHCDTEVLLAAYAQWGKACLNRFNGMFAFLVYDRQSQVLFAARDRFGVKPLYYWVAPNRSIAFGSEIKQFTVLPGWQARMNPQSIYDFLVWGISDHSQETCFNGVYQLEPGTSLTIDCRSYWNKQQGFTPGQPLPSHVWYQLEETASNLDFEQATIKVREQLQESVGTRLLADVPIGACLSGGIDSSNIVGLMAKQQSVKPQTFTACYEDGRFDERHWAEQVVARTGADPHYIYPDLTNLWENLPQLAWYQDEPFGSTSIYAQWNVFRVAHQSGIKVMLDGQGADEQFCGYHPYFATLMQEHLRKRHFLKVWKEMSAIKLIHNTPKRKQVPAVVGPLLPQSLQTISRGFLNKSTTQPAWINVTSALIDVIDPRQRRGHGSDTIQRVSKQELCATRLQRLLHWEDRNSMAHSIEARVPFTDHNLVELVYNLPASFKISQGTTKRILRAATQDILPPAIFDRHDKLGFITPEENWLRHQQPERFRQAVQQSIELSQGVLNRSALTVTDKIIEGQIPFSFLVWRFISFGEWLKTFQVIS